MHSLYKGPELRAWQIEAIDTWLKHKQGIIQAVPGAGKTILALKLICSRIDEEPNLKVLIVCPRLTLIQQWIDAVLEYSKIKRSEIYEVSSNNESKAYVCAQDKLSKYKIFISTFHQIKQFFNECKWKDHDWFLIVDEMHNTTENYKFPNAPIKYKLGLSATPKKRGKDSDFNLGGIVYTYSFTHALKDKIILDPVIKIVFYSVNKQLFKKIQNENDPTVDLIESAYDDFLPDDEIEEEHKAFIDHKKNLEGKKQLPLSHSPDLFHPLNNSKNTASLSTSVDIPLEEPDVFTSKNTDFIGIQRILEEQFHIGSKDSLQTLVFVNRIKKADLLNQMLAEKFSEKVSKSYHSKSEEYNTRNHFNDLKRQFAEGKFNVLISVGTLGEGIDFPYASHGIIASPIYNPTSFVQKVGRLLRSYKDHKKAVIYYYVPSELVTRLLTDERIEPNYFKSVIKIADENGDLYFVDRESLSEERGSLSELLIKGAAYERNEDIKRIKIPHDLDSIMRFFKRVYPENLKNWKKFYAKQIEESANKEEKNNKSNAFQDLTSINKNAFASKLKSNKQSITQILGENEKELALGEEIDDNQIVSEKEVVNKKPKEIDFTPLRIELSKNHAIMLRSAVNLLNNLRNISSIQKRFAGKRLSGFIGVKEFVKEGLKHQIITKIKYGGELESIAKESSSLPFSEQEMLCNAISAELNDFCVKQKQLAKALNTLSNAVAILEKYSKKQSKQKSQKSGVQNPDLDIKNKINGMNKISKTFFDLQSLFLDELDLADLSKSVTDTEKKFFLTIGKDIFLTKHLARKFSYPEDFGLSRWQEEKEPEVIVIQLSPIEKFAKRLMFLMSRGKDEREEDTSKDNSKDNSKENNNTTAGNKKSSTIKEIAPVNEEPSVCAIDDWDLLKKNICMDLKIKEPENEEVLKELERHKFEKEFSFEKLFFVTEAIKREKKKKTQV